MLYQNFQECKLSALGLGCMRLPVVNGEDNRIDQNRLNEMVDEALSLGINYFDTAYLYHGGSSEPAVGEALRRHPRESYFLATKFPSFKPEFFEKKEEIFEEQLRRCGVDYFDFYLCHNVAEKNVDDFLSEEHGLIPYLLEQKRLGRIRHLGFSTHGSRAVIKLRDYDKEHKTEYFDTLRTYITCQMNAVKAAKELFIHRSTFLYRMAHIKELVDIDLEDSDQLLYLLLTYKLLEKEKTEKNIEE